RTCGYVSVATNQTGTGVASPRETKAGCMEIPEGRPASMASEAREAGRINQALGLTIYCSNQAGGTGAPPAEQHHDCARSFSRWLSHHGGFDGDCARRLQDHRLDRYHRLDFF